MSPVRDGDPPWRPVRPGGHPLHPATVHLPLGLLVASTLWDAVALWQADPLWWSLAFWCMAAGCAAALPAAATGFLEWIVLPRRPEVMRAANRHLFAALTAVTLYGVSLLVRGGASVPAPGVMWPAVALSATGLASLALTGWWGGALVYGHGVAVRDPRGADRKS